MSTPEESQSPRERTWIYIVVGAISIVLVVLGLVLFDSAKETKEAEAKADQYIAALETVGVPAPPRDEVVRVLGSDGGATCDDPNDALSRATLKSVMSNGAAGPGMRPVIFDRRYLAGQLLILKIYCPE
jgi:hypothetical protein